MLRFSILSEDDERTFVSLVHGGRLLTADSDHPNYAAIIKGLLEQDESVVDLFDPSVVVSQKFQKVSDRVSVSGGRVFFDGDEVANALTRQILRFLEEGADFTPLVNFFEKVEQNPSEDSKENLYRWLDSQDFTITTGGDIVGYKGVTEGLTSIHTGPAIVDGTAVNGHVPNQPGSVVEMARSQVTFDPDQACSFGLHVGTYDYARSFGRVVLEVHVNPRDVVSVPADHHDTKMRVCRYTVVDRIEAKYDEAVIDSDDDDDAWWLDDDEDDDEDY